MSSETKFCGNCGARLRTGSRFCVECGEAVAEFAPAPVAQRMAGERSAPAPSPYDEPAYRDERTYQTEAVAPPAVVGWDATAAPPPTASLVSRFVALLIDSLTLFGVFYLVGSLVANTTDDTTEYGFNLEGGPAGVVLGLSTLAVLLYYVLFEGTAGATLGKLVMGIRVERRGGGRAGIAAALIRTLLRLVDGLFGYLVGLIAALTSPLRQRIGDRAAGTIVARWPRPAGVRLGALIVALLLAVGGTAIGVLVRDPADETVSATSGRGSAGATVTGTLARGATSDFRPVDPTNRFAPAQESFFVTFQYSGVEPGAEIRCVWSVVDVGSAAEKNAVIDEVTARAPNREGSGSFSLRRSTPQWPVGTYKVELFVNGRQVAELPFSVAR